MNDQQPYDLDLDLDISAVSYDGPIFSADQLGLRYNYEQQPGKTYVVCGDAIVPVVRRMSNESIIQLSIQAEKIRYVIQQEIGKRNIGDAADKAAAKHFQVGKLEDVTTDIKRVQVDPAVFDGLDDLDI